MLIDLSGTDLLGDLTTRSGSLGVDLRFSVFFEYKSNSYRICHYYSEAVQVNTDHQLQGLSPGPRSPANTPNWPTCRNLF